MTDALDQALANLITYDDVRFDDLETATYESQFVEAGFGLLNQTLKYLHLTAQLYRMDRPDGLERDEAIVVGHLVRMYKLVHNILGKAQQDRGGDQHSALARQFLEGVSVIEYLVQNATDSTRFDAYVQDGLIAEKHFSAVVADEVAKRDGSRWEIENRLDTSIDNTFRSGGVDKESLRGRRAIGFPNVENRMKVFSPTLYASYRASSAGIHGTWSDVGNNHLMKKGDKFHPNFDPYPIRPQIFTSMSLWGTRACLTYINAYLPEYFPRVQTIFGAQIGIALHLDELHEKWLNSRDNSFPEVGLIG